MTASGAAASILSARDTGAEALAQGLLLARASTINLARLQLAMERCDRRAAIETLDELLTIERRMGALAGDLAPDDLRDEAGELDEQHRALAVERLVLAAGTKGPLLAAVPERWIDQPPSAPEAVPACIAADTPEELRRVDAGHALVALIVAALLAGTAAFLFFTHAGRGLIGGSL